MFRPGPYTLTPLAATGETFADFAPYVPSISNDGAVAFQATLRAGGSGVYVVRAGPPEAIIDPAGGLEVVSHPDINRRGSCCFYARSGSGAQGVFVTAVGRPMMLAPGAGPLGPTINDEGAVAFRGASASGGSGIYKAEGGSVTKIAETGARFSAFHGLPVINGRGAVAFRADLALGGQVIAIHDGASQETLVATGETFSALGAFPAMNDAGVVVFCAALRGGGSGIFRAAGGKIGAVIDDHGPFESFRGALVDGAGRIVFYATPRAGSLGIFTGPDPRTDRLLSVGAPLLGSTVTEFALNPVSINEAGQLAIRVSLADDRRLILRADSARGDPGSRR